MLLKELNMKEIVELERLTTNLKKMIENEETAIREVTFDIPCGGEGFGSRVHVTKASKELNDYINSLDVDVPIPIV